MHCQKIVDYQYKVILIFMFNLILFSIHINYIKQVVCRIVY